MKLLTLFLSVLALLGLLVIPVSANAAGNAMATFEKSSIQTMAAMGDMPCCPEKQPVKPNCGKDCPLVIICTTSTSFSVARSDWSPAALHWSRLDYARAVESRLASLVAEPPARPPKI
jgi:hypothetical protein